MCAAREVLLVGEGNFSFSVALIESSMDELNVTATCLQSEDVSIRMDGTRENIQRLRDCGEQLYFLRFYNDGGKFITFDFAIFVRLICAFSSGLHVSE